MKLLPDPLDRPREGKTIPETLQDLIIPWTRVSYREYGFGYALVQELETPEFSVYSWRVESFSDSILYLLCDQPVIGLLYVLRQPLYVYLPGSRQIVFRTGTSNLCYFPKSEYKAYFQPGLTETFLIQMGPSLIHDIQQSMAGPAELVKKFTEVDQSPHFLQAIPGDWRSLATIRNMRSCQEKDGLLLLELKKGILELLSLYLVGLRDLEMEYLKIYIPGREIYEEIRQYILASPNIHRHSLYNLSRRYGIGEAMLARNFRNMFGMSPALFVRQHVLEKARSMLLSTTLSVEQIATECGYSEANNFYPAFKKRYGVSPSGLRREAGKSG